MTSSTIGASNVEPQAAYALRPLSTAELLDKAFIVYRKHFLLFAGIMIWPYALNILLRVYREFSGTLAFGQFDISTSLRISAAVFAFGVVAASGAATFAVSQVYLGGSATILASYRSAWTHSLFAATLCGALVYFTLWSLYNPFLILLELLTRVLIRVFFIWLLPVAILENLSLFGSLSRSFQLARKRFGQLALMVLLALSVSYGLSQLVRFFSSFACGVQVFFQ